MTPMLQSSGVSVVETLRKSIEAKIARAEAVVSGAGGHFTIEVTSPEFAGKSPVDRQRLVLGAIAHLMHGDQAPVHAIDSLKTRVPGDAISSTRSRRSGSELP
jgi:acid stress-induced BolA-like protein IbaG/YrbA